MESLHYRITTKMIVITGNLHFDCYKIKSKDSNLTKI